MGRFTLRNLGKGLVFLVLGFGLGFGLVSWLGLGLGLGLRFWHELVCGLLSGL